MAACGCGLNMFVTWQMILLVGSVSVRAMGGQLAELGLCVWAGEAGTLVAIKPLCAVDDIARMQTLENSRKCCFMNG